MLEERQAHGRARFVVFSGHVHNYGRHEHGGAAYFVSGGRRSMLIRLGGRRAIRSRARKSTITTFWLKWITIN